MASAHSTCHLFRKFAGFSPHLHFKIMVLQNRVLQNCNTHILQSSLFSVGDKYEKFFQSRFRKVRVYCPINSNQNRAIRQTCKLNFNASSSANGPILAIANQHQFKAVTSGSLIPWNFCGYGLRSPHSGACTKRSFSNIPTKILSGDGTARARSGGKTSLFSLFNANKRRTKSLKPQNKNGKGGLQVLAFNEALEIDARNSEKSTLKGRDKVESKEHLGNHIDDPNVTTVSSSPVASVKKSNKAKGKQTEKLRDKKENVIGLEATSPADVVANSEGSKKVSQLIKTSMGKSCSATENQSVPTKKQPEKRATKYRGNKTKREAVATVTTGTPTKLPSESDKKLPSASGKAKAFVKEAIPQLYPPSGKSVVVVESATKAKVIQGYLGDMFEVLPSYGHVRDLAARSGSVRPNDDFSMVWEVPSAAWTHLKSIKVALSGAKNLILASDPDREGEAIAWHIIEMLQQQDALCEDIIVARVVFNEISESSIKSALQAPREIDQNLVQAYLARRALDYLIGFNISPLLWRKLPGCQSAGRVQSAALALISDREMEIDEFKPQEYWSVDVEFKGKELGSTTNNFFFSSHLTHFGSEKLEHLSISSQTLAKEIEEKIISSSFNVVGCKRSKHRKNPSPPLITSTLQQEAANKLHFPATYTMKLAQKLYEGVVLSNGVAAGLITYIRTDGLYISDEAIKNIREVVVDRYGQGYALGTPRKYFKKVKNAQEAHEAIRPTYMHILPSTLAEILDEDSLKLYSLIWARTMACQMEPATFDQVQLDVGNSDHSITFRAACSRVGFLGYQAVYNDLETKAIRIYEIEENDRNEAFQVIYNLKTGDSLCLGEVELKQHHTQPPPRYSEAALVKKLEELGIGRPSTYASTLKVLQDRKYVTMKSRVLYPEFRGRMVSAFLSHHFSEVTDYSFTADMETELDNVSAGMTEWKGLLKDYWTRFSGYCDRAASVHIHQVEKMLEKTFGDYLFASLPNNSRACPSCLEGTLNFKVSRLGAGYFIGCDQHPKCKYIAKTLYGDEDEEDTPQQSNTVEEPKFLGVHPNSNEKIFLKNGPYGRYVQLGEDRKGYLPKRASASQIKDAESITFEDAIGLLQYPVTLGKDPERYKPVILKLTKNGFAIKHGCTTAPVPKNQKPNDITLEQALKLLKGDDAKHSGRPKKKREAAVEAI